MDMITSAVTQVEVSMDADLLERQAIGWVVVVDEDDDWSGVHDCGAIFRPDEPIFWLGDRDDWPMEQCS
jgi:hypothetical protein